MQAQINPDWLEPAVHREFLNRVFPGSWNAVGYEWYQARRFNGVDTDLVVLASGDRILASLALCHRQIGIGTQPPLNVCVISAAATAPEERNRGHYACLLGAAIEQARARACVALLGFVTSDNGSGRGLRRIGARMLPSFYIASTRRSGLSQHSRRRLPDSRIHPAANSPALVRSARAAFERSGQYRASEARFVYARNDDWERQFVHRPNSVRVVRLAHDSFGLVETVGATDRLQWLSCPDARLAAHIGTLAAHSARGGRNFFMYTLDAREAAAARRAGLHARSGYLILQPSGYSNRDWARLAGAAWRVQSGDRL